MAGQDRTETLSLEKLAEEPHFFDFFQTVRRIECARTDLPRVGYSQHLAEDALRFGQEVEMTFAPAAMCRFVPETETEPSRLYQRFFGLTGPMGPMPIFFTEFVRDRRHNSGDETLARFMDVFHHRMIGFFYRAWASSRQSVQFDRDEPDDIYSRFVGSLIGVGMDSLRKRDALPDRVKFHFSGSLGCQTRHADGLRAALAEYFGVPVRIEEFVPQWLDLPEENQCRMGQSRETGMLGLTLIVGSRYRDCQQKFRLVLGPLTFAQYTRMLPGGKSLERLIAWVRNYVGDSLMWDARLVLLKAEVPETRLGKQGRVGWTSWLRTKPFEYDADHLVLNPSQAKCA